MMSEAVPDWLRESGCSPFALRVYVAALSVPAGRVTTYKQLADAIGCGSPRAVGQALKRNPLAPRVPCHRVIRSDGGLGGFSGHMQGAEVQRKAALLRDEGVPFHAPGRVDPAAVVRPAPPPF